MVATSQGSLSSPGKFSDAISFFWSPEKRFSTGRLIRQPPRSSSSHYIFLYLDTSLSLWREMERDSLGMSAGIKSVDLHGVFRSAPPVSGFE